MKKNLKPRALMYPSPAVLACAYDGEGNVDVCTLAFATMCSHHPPCIMIAINTTARRKTLKSILEKEEFTVAFPDINQMAEADYFEIESGYNENKIEKVGFTTKDAEFVDAPIINEIKVSAECKVAHISRVGSHTQIIGEIFNIQSDEDVLDEKGKISFDKLNPLAYDDVGHEYYEMGEKIGKAFKVGLI